MRTPAHTLVIILFGCACLPKPHSVLGKTCAQNEECGEDLVCLGGVCATPDDRPFPPNCSGTAGISDGFEGGLALWNANTSATSLEVEHGRVRTGDAAMRVLASSTAASRFVARGPSLPAGDGGVTMCAAAWLVGTSGLLVDFTARRYASADRWEDTSSVPMTVSPSQWTRTVTWTTTTSEYAQSVRFRLSADTTAGSEFVVDDVRIWPEPSGDCLSAVDAGCAP